MEKLSKYYIKKIYYRYVDFGSTDSYLNMLIEFENNKYLYFNSVSFFLLEDIKEYDLSIWENVEYDKIKDQLIIIQIKEHELNSYFIEFSNHDIFYIYQQLDGMENVVQYFQIVGEKDKDYQEVIDYMKEEFVESVEI